MMSSWTSYNLKDHKYLRKPSLLKVIRGSKRSSFQRMRSRTCGRFLICLIRRKLAELSPRILKRLWAHYKETLQKYRNSLNNLMGQFHLNSSLRWCKMSKTKLSVHKSRIMAILKSSSKPKAMAEESPTYRLIPKS